MLIVAIRYFDTTHESKEDIDDIYDTDFKKFIEDNYDIVESTEEQSYTFHLDLFYDSFFIGTGIYFFSTLSFGKNYLLFVLLIITVIYHAFNLFLVLLNFPHVLISSKKKNTLRKKIIL